MFTYVHAFWNYRVAVQYGGILTEVDVTPEVNLIWHHPEIENETVPSAITLCQNLYIYRKGYVFPI